MFSFPDTKKKLRDRISRYKSLFKKEKKKHGHISDGYGKRYLLFWFYFVLNDLKKSKEYFDWYRKEFLDDVGEPIQKACWAISLHRMGKDEEAKYILADLMLSNLYMIPYLIGRVIEDEYDIWHSSNFGNMDYLDDIPEEITDNIKKNEIEWMSNLYDSYVFHEIRKRYIAIYHELQYVRNIEERRALLKESYSLLDSLQPENY